MGFRNDYILRLIEEMMKVVAHALGLKSRGKYDEALFAINEGLGRLLSLDSHKINLLTADTLLQWCQARSAADPQVTLTVGQAIAAAAEMHAAKGEEQTARSLAAKALHFLVSAHGMAGVQWEEEHTRQVNGLLDRLAEEPLPGHTRLALLAYWERLGQFARAEDELFALVQAADPQGPGPAQLLAVGEAFYQRLLGQSDAALAAGGLPRDEVLEGRAALARRLPGSGG
jgi:hypothetical protein